jgi:signal peptidase I
MDTTTESRFRLKRELVAETLQEFSQVRLVVHGTSMLPAIYPGDCLTVSSFGSAVPCCGDIVLCRRAGEFCVHRIVRIRENRTATWYVLRGDALPEDDPPIPGCELLGRVTSLLRRGKVFELHKAKTLHHRLLRSMIRRSEFTAALLLGWHGLLLRMNLYGELLSRKLAEAEMDRV